MKYYEISYYRTRNWIDKKYVKSELGVTDAICKTKLKKSITDVIEITEEQYIEYSKSKIQSDNRRKEIKNSFIL